MYYKMKHYFLIVYYLGFIKCEKEGFMVGGEVAHVKHFPHSAFLVIKTGKKNQAYLCGASIVNQRIMLTVAHCLDTCSFQNKKGYTMSVAVGESYYPDGFVHKVNNCYVHEDFNWEYLDADIALMKLKKNLEFSLNVQRVALMRRRPYNDEAQVAGWGLLQEDPKVKTKYLYYINQQILSMKECRQLCVDFCHVSEGTLCAASKDRYEAYASFGDSGTALIVSGYIQVGIVSYTVDTDYRRGVVTFYTDTSYYYDWIKRNAKKLYCNG
ncbi:hypothetical protein PYW08_000767 [Mythimna loreyi]|uniref:Uncharacterized protein n=1 Tax=Mythimna loreyi TaxID=667449 RepID=A0ACC2QYH1_9NEOP|nr:hypothetical protein PYW08_000767 [Mythimna loreyi]